MIPIGINVPNFGPETDPASLLGWAQYADRNGFATLLVSDHVAPTREITDTYPAPFYDPFILLGWLAGQTRTGRPLGVGTLDQIVDDLVTLAGLGAVEVIIDPNPDTLRARDFGTEQRQLLEVKEADKQRA